MLFDSLFNMKGNPMVFDFRLKVFYTVAIKLSYTKAAAELYITQPAVSKHINELEQQLNVRLFNRNGSSISITPSGEILLRYAEQIFKVYAQLEHELAETNDAASGGLKVGASTTLAQYVLPRILARFKKIHSRIDIQLIQGNSEYIEQQIISDKIDIALVEGISNHPKINYENFVKDEIVLVARTNNKFISKNEIKVKQLSTIYFVMREQGSGTLDVINKALLKAGLSPKNLQVEMRLDSTESIKEYLMFADCAAFLSIHAITKELQQNQLSIIEVDGIEMYRDFKFIQLHGQGIKLADLFKRFCQTHYNLK